MAIHTRIIDVTRKPVKCPVCGGEVVDIIYGTGDMTETEFFLEYRKQAVMGGDTIPRRPPVWACNLGCKRFRKVNYDGTDAPVRVKLLKNVRPAPSTVINWQSGTVADALESGEGDKVRTYLVDVVSEFGEKETFKCSATSREDAAETIRKVVAHGRTDLVSPFIEVTNIREEQ